MRCDSRFACLLCGLRPNLRSKVKVRANEQESNSFELLQRVQPKLNNEVVNANLQKNT